MQHPEVLAMPVMFNPGSIIRFFFHSQGQRRVRAGCREHSTLMTVLESARGGIELRGQVITYTHCYQAAPIAFRFLNISLAAGSGTQCTENHLFGGRSPAPANLMS